MDNSLAPQNYILRSDAYLQGRSGAIGDEDQLDEVSTELVASSDSYPSDSLLFGEKVCSVRELLQKPSQVFEMIINNGSELYQVLGYSPTITNNLPWTWTGHYKNLFLGLAASERFKFFPKTDSWIGANRINITSTTALNYHPSTMAPMTFCGPNKGMEVNIPFYYPKKFVITRGNYSHTGIYTKIDAFLPDPNPVQIVPYHSLGPDIRATCFRQVPRLAFRNFANPDLTIWYS